MKKIIIIFLSVFIFCINTVAQNVGIGTATPGAKLHINHKATAASPTLRLFDSTAGTGSSILFAKQSAGNTFSIVSTNDIFVANSSLDFRSTFNSGIFLRGDGRVGINNVTSPAATLHVGGGVKINDTLNVASNATIDGNVNIAGNLLTNGMAGTNGQVLTMNGSSMKWMDKSRFMNWAFYHATGSASFTPPPGVTEVLIEMWGAGGGGHNPGGGGGSGGYWMGLIPVTGIATINLTIGLGGAGGANSSSGGTGLNTGFTCTGFNVFTGGGFGADTSNVGGDIFYRGGNGGMGQVSGAVIPAGFRSYNFSNGESGSPTFVTFVQSSSTEFRILKTGGVGGVAPNSGQSKQSAAYSLSSTNNNMGVTVLGTQDAAFGSGGTPIIRAGGVNQSGGVGGPGRIIIYY
jgi:hypothetical protein